MWISHSSTTYELSLKSQNRGASGILKRLLINLGARLSDIVESDFGLTCGVSLYFKNRPRARHFLKTIRQSGLKGVGASIKALKSNDYENRWKEDFRPFKLTKTIDIVPAWEKKTFQPNGRMPVYIDTVNAFGTGLHETTRFIAQLMESRCGEFKSFFDIGTGTGILTLLALKYGVKKVLAVDYDRNALAAAALNFKRNGYSEYVRFLKKADIFKWRGRCEFDFVAANLITLDLIRAQRNILSFVAPGGFLAVSGVSLENFGLFQKKFKHPSLRCVKIVQGKQWVTFLYKRK